MNYQQTNRKEGMVLKAVGDIAPGDFSVSGLGVGSISKKYGCDFIFDKVRDLLGNCDLLLGNLEGVLSQECLTRDLRLCGLPEMAGALRKTGFDVISLANNHTFDYGPDIFKETIFHCEQAGIKICGLRGETEYYSEPAIIAKNSLTIGILAYNWIGLENAGNMGEYIATVEDSIVNYTWNRNIEDNQKARLLLKQKNKNVINDINKLRNIVDVVVLMPHWGYEWTIYPPYGLILEAHCFVEAGVDLILGCHPHVAQGVEKLNASLIVYSLGNFLFDSITDKLKYGMIAECNLRKGSIDSFNLNFVKNGAHYRPEPISNEEFEKNIELIKRSSKAISDSTVEEQLDDEVIYQEYEKQYNYLKKKKVIYLLRNVFKNPFLMKPIMLKMCSLISLIILRLQGRKVRW